jgi:hypothetical protein
VCIHKQIDDGAFASGFLCEILTILPVRRFHRTGTAVLRFELRFGLHPSTPAPRSSRTWIAERSGAISLASRLECFDGQIECRRLEPTAAIGNPPTDAANWNRCAHSPPERKNEISHQTQNRESGPEDFPLHALSLRQTDSWYLTFAGSSVDPSCSSTAVKIEGPLGLTRDSDRITCPGPAPPNRRPPYS